MDPIQETALLNRILTGDRHAFSELVKNYQDLVYRTSWNLMHSREEAEDISQEVFLEVFRSLSGFRKDARLSTWIYRITVNKSLNALRKNKRKYFWQHWDDVLFSGSKLSPAPAISVHQHPDQLLEGSEQSILLDRALASLPEKQKIAFTLHKIEDLSQKEIADILETSVSAVESLIFRAKSNLQKKLLVYHKE